MEPPTVVTGLTVVLVAHDGEWTRRRIDGERGARRLGKDVEIPVYDVHKVGYPQRMRDHDARARILRDRERRSGLVTQPGRLVILTPSAGVKNGAW